MIIKETINTIVEYEQKAALKKVWDSFAGFQNRYNWLITDIDNAPTTILDQKYNNPMFISAEELTKLINNYDNDYFWIWGVFTGISKEVEVNINNLECKPYANGNSELWIDNPTIQYPKGEVELIFWDGLDILLLTKNKEMSDGFRRTFPKWRDLTLENTKDNNNINRIEKILKIELQKRGLYASQKNIQLKYTIWHELFKNTTEDVKDKQVMDYITRLLNK